MKKIFKISPQDIFPIVLVLLLAFSRLIPHPPNFTPVVAVAIMSGYLFKNIYISFAVLITSMLLADAFIGFYKNMFFVYFSLILISYIFYKISSNINSKNLFIFSLLGTIVFFIISNFGVWILGGLGPNNLPYDKNLNGLLECYILAIPFIKNTMLSTLVFTYGAYIANIFFIKKKTS